MPLSPARPLAALLLASLCAPACAETFDACTGFIDTLPAVITTQGNWCLRKDLSTALTVGRAIGIAANNVTIDCNSFKIGGLAGGAGSQAIGIGTSGARLNATVRNCTVRGFRTGIGLGGDGHLVEDNRIEQNLYTGVLLSGDGNTLRRNRILDTGGATGGTDSYGFYGNADVIDNTIAGVYTDQPGGGATGMYANGGNTEIRGNRIRGLVGDATGINAAGDGMTVRDNVVSSTAVQPFSDGVQGSGSDTACFRNTVANFTTAYSLCEADVANLSL